MQINGGEIARDILDGLRRTSAPHKRMVAVLVGEDVASASFLARKAAVARSLSIGFELVLFSGVESQIDIAQSLHSFAADPSVGGIVLQLPVPKIYDRDVLIGAIGTAKDVDNLSSIASVLSPAVLTVQAILASCGKAFFDFKTVRIVGNGFLVGAPIAHFCVSAGIPHEVANSKIIDLRNFVRDGDLVIAGTGKAGIVNPDWLHDGAAAIDFGFPPDFNQDALAANGSRLLLHTPTPFGTGPVLIAKLFENFYALNG